MIGLVNLVMKIRVQSLGVVIGRTIGVVIGHMNHGLMMHGLRKVQIDKMHMY